MRRTFLRLISLSAAQSLFNHGGDGVGMQNALEALQEHEGYFLQSEETAKRVAQKLIELDQSDDDTQHFLGFRSLQNNSNKVRVVVPDSSQSSSNISNNNNNNNNNNKTENALLIIQLMRTFPSSPYICERCCRCLANLCLLPSPTPAGSAPSEAERMSVAQQLLLKEGALPFIIGTAGMSHRLSSRGVLWVALAALNLLCHANIHDYHHHGSSSSSGGGRYSEALVRKAEEALSSLQAIPLDQLKELVLASPADSSGRHRNKTSTRSGSEEEGEDVVLQAIGVPSLVLQTLDATSGALLALLGAQAPENSRGVYYNFDTITFQSLDQTLQLMHLASFLVLRYGRYDGLPAAPLSKRYASVDLSRPDSLGLPGRVAFVQSLPLLAKAWPTLLGALGGNNETGTTHNMILLLEVLNERGALIASRSNTDDGDDDDDGDDRSNSSSFVRLDKILEAALFLCVEMEGVKEFSPELYPQYAATHLAIIQSLESMARQLAQHQSSRSDAGQEATAEEGEDDGEEQSDSQGQRPQNAGDDSNMSKNSNLTSGEAVSLRQGLANALSTGTAAHIGIATLVKTLCHHEELVEVAKSCKGASESEETGVTVSERTKLAPFTNENFTLISQSLLLCHHLVQLKDSGDANDDDSSSSSGSLMLDTVVSSANGIAALLKLFKNGEEGLNTLKDTYGPQLSSLFINADLGRNSDGGSSSSTQSAISKSDNLLFFQQCAILGQIYSILWSLLSDAARTKGDEGAVTRMLEQGALQTSTQIQACLTLFFRKYLRDAEEHYNKKSSDGKGEYVPNAAAETLMRLSDMCEKFTKQLKVIHEAREKLTNPNASN